MYNRYIPQPDGTYQRKRVEEPRREPDLPAPPPPPEDPCPPPKPEPAPSCPRHSSPGRVKRPQAFCSSCFPGILTQGI